MASKKEKSINKAISRKISKLRHEGVSQKQAVGQAEAMVRRTKKSKGDDKRKSSSSQRSHKKH